MIIIVTEDYSDLRTTSSTTPTVMTSASISSCTSKECNYVGETELLNVEQLQSLVNSPVKDTMARMDEKENRVS